MNGSLYAVGGLYPPSSPSSQTNVYRYNGTNWMAVRGLPSARGSLAAGVLDGALYAIGGVDFNGEPSSNVYKYNGTNWIGVAGLRTGLYSLAAGVLNSSLYAVGGVTEVDGWWVLQTNVYRYNGTSWADVAGLSAPLARSSAGVLNGALYVVGGEDSGYATKTNVYRFNGTNWTEVRGLPAPRDELAVGVLNGNLYALGGGDSGFKTNVYRFNGTNWTEVAGLPIAEGSFAAEVLNGTLYVIGGVDNMGDGRTNVYCYPSRVLTSGVAPSSGSTTGGYPVVITGSNLCSGMDITNVTLCGTSAVGIPSQSSTQIIVTAGAGSPGPGHVVVYSASLGATIKSNAFTYVAPPNHAPTNILLSGAHVAENLPVGTKVGHFTTQDPDAGNTFVYMLTNGTGGADNSSFTINDSNLLTAAVFNYEVKSNYSIRVQSADQDGLRTQKVFSIFVTNIEETPVMGRFDAPEGSNIVLRWSSITNHLYAVHFSTNLLTGFSVLREGIIATPVVNSFTDSVLGLPQKYWKITTDP
ncbi:MAG: IPT/TIG domain-containing protein [Lentisphaerota bacterium]